MFFLNACYASREISNYLTMGMFEMLFGKKQEKRIEASKEQMETRAKKEGMKAALQVARTQPDLLERSAQTRA